MSFLLTTWCSQASLVQLLGQGQPDLMIGNMQGRPQPGERMVSNQLSSLCRPRRRGRTGRTNPGKYFCFVSAALYKELQDFDKSGVERRVWGCGSLAWLEIGKIHALGEASWCHLQSAGCRRTRGLCLVAREGISSSVMFGLWHVSLHLS